MKTKTDRTEYFKQYREKNKERRRQYNLEWYAKNKNIVSIKNKKYYSLPENRKKKTDYNNKYRKLRGESWKEHVSAYNKIYNIKNKKRHKERRKRDIEKSRVYARNKLKNDINHKLRVILRGRLRNALNGNYKSGSAVRDLGCTISELKLYLESKFQEGMNWDNYGFYGWHIDHIRPLSSFNLSNRKQFLDAFHFTNLQPLWAIDNFRKGDSMPQ